ncbi:MAG: hypothetical protein ACTHN0_07675, partial [Aquihabitans sp.]
MTIGYGILGVFFVILVANWTGVFVFGSTGTEKAPPLDEAGRPYAESLADALTEPGAVWVGFAGLRPAEADCVAGAWVMTLGPEELDAAGITPLELGEDPPGASVVAGLDWTTGKRIAAEYGRCGVSTQDLLARGRLVAYQDLGEERPDDIDLECVAYEVDDGDADRVFIQSLVDGRLVDPATAGLIAPPRTPAERERFIRHAID